MYSNHYELTKKYFDNLNIETSLSLGVYDMSDYTKILHDCSTEIDLVDNYPEKYIQTAKEYKSKEELQTLLYMKIKDTATYYDMSALDFLDQHYPNKYQFILVDIDCIVPVIDKLIERNLDRWTMIMTTGFFNSFYATEETLQATKDKKLFPYLHIGSVVFSTVQGFNNRYYEHAADIKWDCPVRFLEYQDNLVISLRDYEPKWNKDG